MPLLALIQDPRDASLSSPCCSIAIRACARSPRVVSRASPIDAVAALERLLKREKVREVRVSAVHGLLELYEAGQDPAIRRLSKCFSTPRKIPRSAWRAWRFCPCFAGRAAGLLRRLRLDAIEEIARRAAEITEEDEAPAPRDSPGSRPSCASLRPRTTKSGTTPLHRLAAAGPTASEAIVAEMRRRAGDPEYCTRAGMALKALGPRASVGLPRRST